MIDKSMDIFGLNGWFQKKLFGDVYIEHEERGSRRDGTSKYWRFWLPQLLRSLLMISCAWKRSVKRSGARQSSRLWSSRKSKGGRGPRHG